MVGSSYSEQNDKSWDIISLAGLDSYIWEDNVFPPVGMIYHVLICGYCEITLKFAKTTEYPPLIFPDEGNASPLASLLAAS